MKYNTGHTTSWLFRVHKRQWAQKLAYLQFLREVSTPFSPHILLILGAVLKELDTPGQCSII